MLDSGLKYFLIFLFTVVVVRTSDRVDANDYDVIWGQHRSFENDVQTSHRAKREAAYNDRSVKLPPDYDMFELPKPDNNGPMPLFVFMNISKILDWDELNEFVVLDLRLKVMWTDFKILKHYNNTSHPGNGKAVIDTIPLDEVKRLRKVNNNPEMLSKIWKPNLFIERLVSVNQPVLMTKPLTIRYIPEYGWFEYITRIQIKVDCSMDFQYYPADTQVCHIPIRSYSYIKSDMNLSWHKMGVQLTDLEVSSFTVRIDDVRQFDLAKSYDPNEVHEVLAFSIFARRRLSYHLIQTYLASSFYIVITTLCFLLPSSMIEARIGMSMTTLLTLTAMFASVRESTPIVSYTKAIDIWMVGCIFFVFLTLFQFTFTTWLKHMKMERSEKKVKRDSKIKGTRNEAFEMDSKYQDPDLTETESAESFEKYDRLSKFLESYSFPLFLAIFIIYTAVYWGWLLTFSNHHHWNVNTTWNRV